MKGCNPFAPVLCRLILLLSLTAGLSRACVSPGGFARRVGTGGWLAMLGLVGMLCIAAPAHAQGIELPQLEVSRIEGGGLNLDFEVKLNLSHAVEDALQRGVPMYFTAEAEVMRPRWYWRDERVARASRTWRVAYQPLTSSWRVSLGAFGQTYPSLNYALGAISRTTRWRIADGDQIDAGDHYYVDFSYRLDNSLLPRPLQLDLTVQPDWRLSVERVIKLD
jgi:hypothetical protein